MVEMKSELSIHRTLVGVTGVDSEHETVNLIVPGWNPDLTVTIAAVRITPPELLSKIGRRGFLLANANLSAKRPEDLMLHDFQECPLPISKVELG